MMGKKLVVKKKNSISPQNEDKSYHTNIGWFYNRGYYEGIDNTTENIAALLIKEGKKKKEEEDMIKTFFDKKYDIIRKIPILLDILDEYKQALKETSSTNIFCGFTLEVIYPGLLTGAGLPHEVKGGGELKLGMQFDHTSGLPYIPGSTVKGVLRSFFPDFLSEYWEDKKITDKDIRSFTSAIFCNEFEGETTSNQKQDIFLDAFIENIPKEGLLTDDYITPHPHPLQEPKPIRFLKIAPGTKIIFRFLLTTTCLTGSSSEKMSLTPEDKESIFKEILLTVGIGAKTNVGYGQFKE